MDEEIKPSVAQTEEEVTPEVIEESDSNETETVEDVKARLAEAEEKRQKAEELAVNYKVRAEKAERSKNRVEKTDSISSRDTIAIINAKVHEDDVDDVLEFAKFKKIPVSEALKSGVIKATLKEKQELRDTANATNTSKTRSSNSKVSGDTLFEKARKTGELPDSDDAMAELAEARMQSKKK